MAAERVGKLRRKGFVLVDAVRRRYRDPKGKVVSYRQAFRRATGRTLEVASEAHKGKFSRTTTVAKEMRDAAREGRLSDARLLSVEEERRLGRRSVKSLMRGHTFRSALARGASSARREGISSVERRSAFGRLLAVLQAGESGTGFRRRKGETREQFRVRTVAWESERQRLRASNPTRYKRLFGAKSRKARLLVAMGRRDAGATYDVGETP